MAGTPTQYYGFPTYADADSLDLTAQYNTAVINIDSELHQLSLATMGINGNIRGYGAYGDGEHDDTAAFNNGLEANGYLFVPDGEYYINGTVTIGAGQGIVMSPAATIKVGENGLLFMLGADAQSTTRLIGGCVTGSNCVKCRTGFAYITGVTFKDFAGTAITLGDTDGKVLARVEGCDFLNLAYSDSTVGIDATQTTDEFVTRSEFKNCGTGIKNSASGMYSLLHFWVCSTSTPVTNSVAISGGFTGSDIYLDTVATGIVVKNETVINGLKVFTNNGCVPGGTLPMTVIDHKNGSLIIDGVWCSSNTVGYFLNKNLDSSTFISITNAKMENMRTSISTDSTPTIPTTITDFNNAPYGRILLDQDVGETQNPPYSEAKLYGILETSIDLGNTYVNAGVNVYSMGWQTFINTSGVVYIRGCQFNNGQFTFNRWNRISNT